jgi:hypothetical protein
MTLLFDILQLETNGMVWIEAAPSLADAKSRVQELIARTRSDYIIFDQRTANRLLIKFDASDASPGR